MKLLDLNLLLYAVNADSPHHKPARMWLETTLSADESVAIPWVVILGFLRISTHPHILTTPLSAEAAIGVVDSWLACPVVIAVDAADDHWTELRKLLVAAGTAGNLTTDAHLAALAIEHGAELCSTDSDFARFKGLRWVNPLSE